MRIVYDAQKSRAVLRKHGISLEQACAIFDQAYITDQRNDIPEQFRAIGWAVGQLYSVIYEVRTDQSGEYFHLVTAWKATREEEEIYVEQI